jgi:signal transduction histidine kinase
MSDSDHYRRLFDTLAVAVWEHDFSELKSNIDQLRSGGVTDFRSYVRDHPEFVHAMKQTVVITDVNDTALYLLGVPTRDAFFQRLHQFLDPYDESFGGGIVAIAEGAPTYVSETNVRHTNGELIPVFLAVRFPPDGSYDRVTASMFDARVRLDSEHQLETMRRTLERVQGAASLGELSASIAHEISQPLAAVVNYAHTSRRWLSRDEPRVDEALKSLDDLATAARYATEVVQRVRGLLSKEQPERSPVVIDQVAGAAIRLVRRTFPNHRIVILQELRAPDAAVLGDAVLLQQAIVNLLSNAMQALQEVPDQSRYVAVSTFADSSIVSVTLADTGPGFTEEAMRHVFKNLYTTKDRGMGLGLSIARSAIQAHGGQVEIGNSNRGARVKIVLPRMSADTKR